MKTTILVSSIIYRWQFSLPLLSVPFMSQEQRVLVVVVVVVVVVVYSANWRENDSMSVGVVVN